MSATFKPKRLTIHCTATPDGKRVSIDAIAKDHSLRGFGGIGYHYVIQPDGELCEGRSLEQRGAHVLGGNNENIGIALAGTGQFTRLQFKALRGILTALCLRFSIPDHEIWVHNEWPSAQAQKKTCPGMRAVNLVCWYADEQNLDTINPYILKEEKK